MAIISYNKQIDKIVVIMSSKPKINIDKALRELQISQRFEQADFALTELSHNLPLKFSDQFTNKSGEPSHESKKSAKKVTNNKENQLEFDLKKVKNITYTTLSKTLEQKSHLIEQQKYQIDVLKKCVEEVKVNKQCRQTEESRINSEELAKLKLKEKNYLQNLKEIKLLKGNIEEIRKRYEQMLQEKNTIVAKYNTLLGEHQQLTLSNAHLKLEKQADQQNTTVIELKEEIASLKQQLRKEYLQRESKEARSVNFQKRLSEYIVKFNESQEQYNTCQIKYYKLQKQCDNFRVDKEDIQQKYSNMQRQCIGQREVHQEESAKLRAKLKRSQEVISEQEKCILALRQFQNKTSLQGEQMQKISLVLKKTKEDNIKLQEENQDLEKKWQNYIKQLTKEYSQEKEHLCQEINHCKSLFNQQHLRASSCEAATAQANSSLLQIQKAHEECALELQKFKSKCVELMNENQRIFNHYNSQLFEKQEEIKRSRSLLSYLQVVIEEKNRKQEQIAERINLLQTKLTEGNEYFNENIALQQQVNTLSAELEQTKQQHEKQMKQKQQQLVELTDKFLLVSVELVQSQQRNSSSDNQVERIKQIQEKYCSEMRYYQEKYERQLQQYNGLSKYFHQIQNQHADLLKTKTFHIIQISNLKGEIAQLQTQIHKLTINNEHNSLCVQISSISKELFSLKQQIGILVEESSENQAIIDTLKSQNTEMIQKMGISERHYLIQLGDKQKVISKIKTELEIHVQQVRNLNTNISIIQEKYRSLSQQFQREQSQWNEQRAYLEMQWARLNESNDEEMRQLYNSRTTAQYELDNSQNTIAILKRENSQLQKIFSEEIQRRNSIIRELIKQKKSLYGQFMVSSDF